MKNRFAWGLTGLVAMPVVAVAFLAATQAFKTKELRIFGEVPTFALTERSGKSIGTDELKGNVWVASFIFTHCSGQCLTICEHIKKLESRFKLRDKFRLVSITVDPERDNVDRLKEYALRFKADPYKWLFATGEKRNIDALVQNGFRLTSEGVNHSDKLVLVDARGRIRGYYDGTDEGEMKNLVRDTRHLLRQAF